MIETLFVINVLLTGYILVVLERHRHMFRIYGEAISAIVENIEETSSNS
jgi:hypothetical protein